VAGLAAAGAGALWWGIAVDAALPLPMLVAPFSVLTIGVVAALRLARLRRLVPGRPAPLPLASVGSPEVAWRARLARTRLATLAADARKICVLTGAGVSTGAGLPDVRGPLGLWTRTRDIQLADFVRSAEARAVYWQEEHRFFRLVEAVAPAATHKALAALGREGRLSAVVTQNVDGLHQAAGLPAESVIELHGSIRDAVCLDCRHVVERATLSPRIERGGAALYCPACQGLLKGGSVMFGERVSPERLDAALRAVLAADLLLVLGTSLLVAPASDLLRWARDAGVPIVIVNATPTPHDADADAAITADVDAVMADLAAALAERRAA
jgi:NAD-dependent deacetylase